METIQALRMLTRFESCPQKLPVATSLLGWKNQRPHMPSSFKTSGGSTPRTLDSSLVECDCSTFNTSLLVMSWLLAFTSFWLVPSHYFYKKHVLECMGPLYLESSYLIDNLRAHDSATQQINPFRNPRQLPDTRLGLKNFPNEHCDNKPFDPASVQNIERMACQGLKNKHLIGSHKMARKARVISLCACRMSTLQGK